MDAAHELSGAHNSELIKLFPCTDAQFATETGVLRTAWQKVLPHLRAGAHATDVTPRTTPDAASKDQTANLLTARWVANAAMFEAKALRHEGRHADAVRLSLDGATFAADTMRDGTLINQMIGAALLSIAIGETWSDTALGRLDAEALELLAHGLERVDAQLPEVLDLTSELLMTARALQDVSADAEWVPSAWRYGFSMRWMIGDAFLQYVAAAEEWLLAPKHAWPQRRAMLTAAGEEIACSSNPFAAMVMPNLLAAEHGLREVLAKMRLLRIAVELHRGRDATPLRDPLGSGPLVVTREDGGVRITSAGSTEHRKVERFVAR